MFRNLIKSLDFECCNYLTLEGIEFTRRQREHAKNLENYIC